MVWAASKLKRPVKWQSDRSEGFVSDNQGRDHIAHAELALDAEGRFLGVRVADHRQSRCLSVADGRRSSRPARRISSAGLYTTPAIAINVKGVCTNTVPVCAYRGAGRPEASYLIERLVDAAARDIGMSPDEIRRLNLIPPSAIPYTSATKITFDSGEFEKMMDLCIEKADWAGFAARRKASEKRGLLRGIGMATYTERCGGGFPRDRLDRVQGRPRRAGDGQPGIRHRPRHLLQAGGVGPARHRRRPHRRRHGRHRPLAARAHRRLARACRWRLGAASRRRSKIIDKGRQIAAHLLEAAAVDIEFGDGQFRVVGTDRRIDLFDGRRPRRATRHACRPA